MQKIQVLDPVPLDHLYEIPPDDSPWPDQVYRAVLSAKGVSRGHAPARPRAGFRSHSNGMIARAGREGDGHRDLLGIYMLAFTVPEQWFYVGIAAPGRSPEGVLSRIRKHRVKTTGSHVGTERSDGGVNHTVRWRTFAPRRYRYFAARGDLDILPDAWLIIAQPPIDLMEKSRLETVEHLFVSDEDGHQASVLERIPGWDLTRPVYSLNARGAPLPKDWTHE